MIFFLSVINFLMSINNFYNNINLIKFKLLIILLYLFEAELVYFSHFKERKVTCEAHDCDIKLVRVLYKGVFMEF
jgi:hypothetical protein